MGQIWICVCLWTLLENNSSRRRDEPPSAPRPEQTQVWGRKNIWTAGIWNLKPDSSSHAVSVGSAAKENPKNQTKRTMMLRRSEQLLGMSGMMVDGRR